MVARERARDEGHTDAMVMPWRRNLRKNRRFSLMCAFLGERATCVMSLDSVIESWLLVGAAAVRRIILARRVRCQRRAASKKNGWRQGASRCGYSLVAGRSSRKEGG